MSALPPKADIGCIIFDLDQCAEWRLVVEVLSRASSPKVRK